MFVCLLVFVGALVLGESVRLHDGALIDFGDSRLDPGIRFKCSHSRVEVMQQALRYIDTNQDNCIDATEIEDKFSSCLSWYERTAVSLGEFFGAIVTPDKMMHDCDINGDEKLCVEDAVATHKTCAYLTPKNISKVTTCICDCNIINGLYEYIFLRQPC